MAESGTKHRHTVPTHPTTPTHFGGHHLREHSTRTNSLVDTSEWELLLRPPHRHSHTPHHYSLHLHAQCSVQPLTLQHTIGPAESDVACGDISR